MALTTLQVVNSCLATLGEVPLNSVDEDHPFVSSALRILDVAMTREQAKSWWFNKECVELAPDATDQSIYLPDDTLSVDPTDQGMQYVQRGRRLFKRFAAANEDPYKFSSPVKLWLVRLVPFTDLPALAQVYIAACAVYDFQKDYDADTTKMARHERAMREALINLNAEHIRNEGANLLQRASTFNSLAAARRSPGMWTR